jgi:TrmH family RNA methyltransferase
MISKSQMQYIRSLHSKKQRSIDKRFIAEGIKTVAEILDQKAEIINHIFCTEDFYTAHERILNSKKIEHTRISEKELSQISQLTTPNAVVAVCDQLQDTKILSDLNNTFAFYLDDIRDPGNFGTIVRVCSWFGIKDLFCSEETVELYNPKVIQACMGAFLRVNVHYVPLTKLITDQKISKVYATVLEGKNIYTEELKNGLIIIGNEAKGIGPETLRSAKESITIPSASGNTESLNAAVATSIIASEFFRRNL